MSIKPNPNSTPRDEDSDLEDILNWAAGAYSQADENPVPAPVSHKQAIKPQSETLVTLEGNQIAKVTTTVKWKKVQQ